MMRQILLVIAGAPGRVAVSAAALATVALTAGGFLPALVGGAVVMLGWSSLLAVGFLALVVAENLAGVYDDDPPAPRRDAR